MTVAAQSGYCRLPIVCRKFWLCWTPLKWSDLEGMDLLLLECQNRPNRPQIIEMFIEAVNYSEVAL